MDIAFFDLDKTIYNNHSFFEIAKFSVDNGRASEKSWNKIQSLLQKYKSGALSYQDTANKLLELFSFELKDQKYADLLLDTQEFFTLNKSNFYSYFAKILPELKKTHDVYLVTTNAQFAAESVVKEFNLSGYIATEFEVKGGLFTGSVARSLANGKGMIKDLLKNYGVTNSIAVGDSENDISMLELVDVPLCINPNAELKKWAIDNNAQIFNEDEALEVFNNLNLKK